MVTKKRINEIRRSGLNLSEQTKIELRQTIEEGDRMSEENRKLFSSLLGC